LHPGPDRSEANLNPRRVSYVAKVEGDGGGAAPGLRQDLAVSDDDFPSGDLSEEQRLFRADVPVRLPGESRRRFSRWLDKQLAELEARWAHLAAPATRPIPPKRRIKRLPR